MTDPLLELTNDKAFRAIIKHLRPCYGEMEYACHKYKTFSNAWNKCNEPQLFGWLLGRLAKKHKYYQRAVVSVISQLLYDFYINDSILENVDNRLLEFTEMLGQLPTGPACRLARFLKEEHSAG